MFSTAADNQTSVEIHILQGERPMAADNKTLGQFMLDGIPTAPRGIPQIEVTLDIDANGILNVSAKDKATGKVQSVRIEASTQLSKEEIEKLKQEAVLHAEEDAKKRALIEARNHAEQLLYTAEKSLKEANEKVSEEIKKGVQDAIDALKAVKDGEDGEAVIAKTEALSTELQKIGSAMYTQEEPSAEKPADETPNEENTTTQ